MLRRYKKYINSDGRALYFSVLKPRGPIKRVYGLRENCSDEASCPRLGVRTNEKKKGKKKCLFPLGNPGV